MTEPAITTIQAQVLQHMLSGHTITRAAELAGVHRSTVHLWLKQPLFRHTLENAQREHYLAIQFSLATAAEAAVEGLRAILDDPKASAHARLKAAQYLLNRLDRIQPAAPTHRAEVEELTAATYHPETPHVEVKPDSTEFDTKPTSPTPRPNPAQPTETPLATDPQPTPPRPAIVRAAAG